MIFRPRARWASALALALAFGTPSSGAEKRPIAETDLFRFVWVADPRISPDGKRVAFVRVAVNKKKEGYDTAVWIVPTDGSAPPRAFTGGEDMNPRWSPDGTRLAFNRVVEKDGKRQPPQLWVMPTSGGEARVLTDLPKGAGPGVWSPDGKTIAFTTTTNDKDMAQKAKEKEKKEARKDDKAEGGKDGDKEGEEHESDVRVVTRAIYRFNGPGYLDPTRPTHIWTVEVPEEGATATPRQVTTGSFAEDDPAWSKDGQSLFFASTRVKEPYYSAPDGDLFTVPAAGGEVRKAADIDGPIGDYALSPDGKQVAFVGFQNGKPERSYDETDLFVGDAGGAAAARNLTASADFDVDGGLTGDQRAPRGTHPSGPVWSRDGSSLFVKVAEKGRCNLRRIDVASSKVEPLTEGDQEVMSYTATADAERFALVLSTPTSLGDLFALETGTKQMRRLTHLNDELFAELELTAPEEITYASFDGKKIHGLVQKPSSFDAAKKYPLILNIHGGPHAAYGYTFFHEMQWMAAKGYVVLYPNPRGSSSYGQEFGNVIQYHYPGDDYKDLMAGVDELVKRGTVDPQRLGVTGGSGGGVLTNWTVTQTDRFAAAVSQRSISDWAGWWYTADFTLFTPKWFRGAPFEQPADFAARSAITRVARVKTPLMLIEGEVDWRTPASAGGEDMFRALKYLKKPTVMVRFPDESHELSRSGRPWHRVERLQHIVGWFDKYLMGKATDAYDVP
jgi:dipeptidyl aminopeptidase/acylaminoacyl peptidase